MKVKVPSNKKISITDSIISYHKPSKVFIPLIIHKDKDVTVLVKKGDYVYKGMIIGKTKGNFRSPIHSSVSGTVLGMEEKLYVNGDKIKCIAIENDFKETVEVSNTNRKNLSEYSKEEFIEKIKEAGIMGMGGSGFPTYVKYNTKEPIKTIVINAVECEPYITADHMLFLTKCEQILEMIDALIEINKAEEAIIAIKSGNNILKDHINNFIGTYLDIKIVEVPDYYPMGWEKNVVKYTTGKKYKKLPIEVGVVVSNASTIYAIWEALKLDRPLIERVVTFTGDGLNNPQNVLVRFGTKVSDVIEYIGGVKEGVLNLISGGPMMGEALESDELVVTGNLNCVLIQKDIPHIEIEECLRCGKCANVCPAKLSPVLIKDNLKNMTILSDLEPERCIECGLCSYICPAKIPIREFVKLAKKQTCEVKKK